MKEFNVYESLINSDSNEGKGHSVHVAYFVREADAALSVKGKDAWGSDGSEGVAQATRRQAALDKLSDDDKKALE